MEKLANNKINLIPRMCISIDKFNEDMIQYVISCKDLNIDGSKPITYCITYPKELTQYEGEYKCIRNPWLGLVLDVMNLIGNICNLYRQAYKNEKGMDEGGVLYHNLSDLIITGLILDPNTNELYIEVDS